MAVKLCYSNDFDELVAALCEDMRSERSNSITQIFTPAEIVVPNDSVTGYLKFAIAKRLGIAANIRFLLMPEFLANRAGYVRKARAEEAAAKGLDAPAVDEPELRVLDKIHLHALLCSVLADDRILEDEDMGPVRSYLRAVEADPDAVDLRRYQLAEQLATLFIEYSLHRSDMIRKWPEGLFLESTRAAVAEAWQRKLWLAVFGPGGAAEELARETGLQWVTAPELFRQVLAKHMGLPRNIYFIGFSYMPWAHQLILDKLGKASTVRVYAVNPCMEFWEDVRSGWEQRLAGRELQRRSELGGSQLSFADIEDTPALKLWGRPGRDNILLLNEHTQCDFDSRFVDPVERHGKLTMLTALQRDILFRAPERSEPGDIAAAISPDDDSIRIFGCPSVQRELEVVGNEIWRLIHADPTLRFNEIAVLVSRADQELYQARIPAVFAELQSIPHHLVEIPLSAESRIVEAFRLLIALPFGRFTRPELLRLLTHPALLARYPDVDASDWIYWSERLGIVHGADHSDHANTYIEKDVFNWQQGIRRLALGAFMAGERSGVGGAVSFGEAMYLPEELPADRLSSAARFALIARSLISDARYCRSAVMPLSDWRLFFEVLLSSYIAAETSDDERNLARCREAIEALAEGAIDNRPVSYRVAAELLRAELDNLRGQSGEYLAHGVVVAPLLPMRPIPFRVIFLVGLGEGRFPLSERESPLDLRAARRRRGDITPRERDRYLFLETLLAARERLYLTYVSRDDQTGETLQPSSVVLELSHMLKRGYASGKAAEGIATHHPLRRYDPRYFPALFDLPGADAGSEPPMVSVAPAAHRQANALALRRHLESKLRELGMDMPSAEELSQALKSPRFAELRERLGLVNLEGREPPSEDTPAVAISLAMLRRFLECPLQAWASAVLRLRESDMQDLVSRQDEAFAIPVGSSVGILRDVFTDYLLAGGSNVADLMQRYHRRVEHAELTGNAPIGVFSQVEQERHSAILSRWHMQLAEMRPSGLGRVHVYYFGRAAEHLDIGELLPPILLTVNLPDAAGHVRPVQVELYGQTEAIGPEDLGSVVLNHRPKTARKHLLRGFIDHIALSATGLGATLSHATTVLSAGTETARYHLRPWSEEDARAYLGVLVADLLGSAHEYLLPCEAVFEQADKPGRNLSIGSIIEGYKLSGRGFSSLYGPISQINNLHAPMDAQLIIERRFGPLFIRLQEAGPDLEPDPKHTPEPGKVVLFPS